MDSIGRADAMLSARRPGITASSLRSRVESSVRSAYDLGSGVLGSGVNSLKSSIPDNVKEGAQRFTLACLFIVAVEFAERFVYYSGKNMFGTYTKVNPFPFLPFPSLHGDVTGDRAPLTPAGTNVPGLDLNDPLLLLVTDSPLPLLCISFAHHPSSLHPRTCSTGPTWSLWCCSA